MLLNEKYIISFPEHVSLLGTQRILNKMRNCIFKIKSDNTVGNGFFILFLMESKTL
jgi:hypothetical protein